MSLDYRTVNTLWASIAVETLARLGLRRTIVCPGSRSTPLTIALAAHPQIEAIPILDERSAAFFALGSAKSLHQPVLLLCTSGTAGANFYPAVIEAKESQVPLLVLTADRPPEMRDCASGQTIDQQKLFGTFVNSYTELAVPDLSLLTYLRQTLISVWVKAQYPDAGPVHLNCPFRDPLTPSPSSPPHPELKHLSETLDETIFFSTVISPSPPQTILPLSAAQDLWSTWQSQSRGLIIAGPAQPKDPWAYVQAVNILAQQLQWPVLAEALSPLRNYQALNPYLIATYDSVLPNILLDDAVQAQALVPDIVIQLGALPTSKALRQWLGETSAPRWLVDPSGRQLDPLHGLTHVVITSVEALAQTVTPSAATPPKASEDTYLKAWLQTEQCMRHHIEQTLATEEQLFEGKIAWLLAQVLPPETPLFIANSMPVRDMETFWLPNDRHIRPYFSRGANGIDGTLSTAMGMAHRRHPSSVLLTGDLAFLHDTNGLLNTPQLQGHLTIVLVNNQGGGIFEMLPISQFEPPFEQYFATPQQVNLSSLCKAYEVDYTNIEGWPQLIDCLKVLPKRGMRLLEIKTSRKADTQWRKTFFNQGIGSIKV